MIEDELRRIDLLSAAPERLPSLIALVREYILLPDAWVHQGGPPERLPSFFEEELSALPQPAVPPRGEAALCVNQNDVAFGVALLVPFSDDEAEIKRLYVRATGRRRGAGATLVTVLLEAARSRGYLQVVVDVMRQRVAALRLYERLAFVETAPFRQYSSQDMCFYRLSL